MPLIKSTEYTEDYYRLISKTIESDKFILSDLLKESLEFIDLDKASELLDVGCGCGEVVIYCARQGIYSVGIDYSIASLKNCRQLFNKQVPDTRKLSSFLNMDASVLGFKESAFDTVILFDVIEHLDEKISDSVLNEIRRVLQKGGRLYLHTDNRLFILYGRPVLNIILSLFLKKKTRRSMNPGLKYEHLHVKYYNKNELKEKLMRFGFEARIKYPNPVNNPQTEVYFPINNPFIKSILLRVLVPLFYKTPLYAFLAPTLWASCVFTGKKGTAD